jgi:hypothetical protein
MLRFSKHAALADAAKALATPFDELRVKAPFKFVVHVD